MKDRKNLLIINELFSAKAFAADGPADVPDSIALSKTGIYTPAYGRAREIRADHLDQMVKNFNNKVMKTRISIYYSHWDMRRTAAGELKSLNIVDDPSGDKILKGEVSWTANGKKALEDREYKYVSAEIDFDFSRARDTDGAYDHFGVVLTGVALTNEPAVYDLPAIVFSGSKKFIAHFSESCQNKNKSKGDVTMDKVFKLLNVKTEEEVIKKFSMLVDKVEALEKSKETDDFSKKLKEKDEKITSLTESIQKIKDEQFSKEKKDYLDKIFKDNKITSDKHKEAMSYGEDKFSMFKEVMDSLKTDTKVVPEPKGESTFSSDAGKPEIDLKEFAKKFSSLDDLNIGV